MSSNSLILIVDDNVENIKVLGTIVEQEGYEVAAALGAAQALEFLGTESPDLILLDVMMPGIDGFELCRKIKGNKETKAIPVIFLTAKTETRDLLEGFKAGGVDYVTKPFNSAELLVRVKTHIELKKAREEIQALRGMIPICCHCKKIRNDDGYWNQLEVYIEQHTEASFSHGICPTCAVELYGELGIDAMKKLGMTDQSKPEEK